MKAKSKPVARADIRERLEKKFRARGALAFHLLAVLGAGLLLLYALPDFWAARFSVPAFQEHVILYAILSLSGALHFIRYHFRHGAGRDWHERRLQARIERQLALARADEADERAELARLQAGDQLKNRRLLWQHIAVFVVIFAASLALHTRNAAGGDLLDWQHWRDVFTLFGAWAMILAAHGLRYALAYGRLAQGRAARIEAQVTLELERERSRQSSRPDRGHAEGKAAASLDELASIQTLSLDELEATGSLAGREIVA